MCVSVLPYKLVIPGCVLYSGIFESKSKFLLLAVCIKFYFVNFCSSVEPLEIFLNPEFYTLCKSEKHISLLQGQIQSPSALL